MVVKDDHSLFSFDHHFTSPTPLHQCTHSLPMSQKTSHCGSSHRPGHVQALAMSYKKNRAEIRDGYLVGQASRFDRLRPDESLRGRPFCLATFYTMTTIRSCFSEERRDSSKSRVWPFWNTESARAILPAHEEAVRMLNTLPSTFRPSPLPRRPWRSFSWSRSRPVHVGSS